MKLLEHWLEGPVNNAVDLLPQKLLAVDVGANVGTWSSAMAEEFESVLAIEPDPRAGEQLRSMPPNVVPISVAVADESGPRTLFVRPHPEQNSLLSTHPIGGNGGSPAPAVATTPVMCKTLDDLCPEGADLVKIDIEGAEVMALQGCQDVDRWDRAVFVVECHDTYDAVADELDRLRKRVTRVPHPFPGAHPQHCWAIGE